jgi:cytochrome c
MRTVLIAAIAVLFAVEAQAADPKHGKEVFARCAICHSDAKGAGNRIGPNLFAVVGRKAGTFPGFSYSSAMKSFAKVWTPQQLDVYLTKPGATVPGTKMSFSGLSSKSDRADVIAYLQSLK